MPALLQTRGVLADDRNTPGQATSRRDISYSHVVSAARLGRNRIRSMTSVLEEYEKPFSIQYAMNPKRLSSGDIIHCSPEWIVYRHIASLCISWDGI